MKIHLTSLAELSGAHREAWSELQRTHTAFDSPYFCPEFALAVAEVRDDVELAVLEEGGEPRGFFPFQRSRRVRGQPVGGRLSDFQGVVADPGLEFSASELLEACRLRTWDFDHLVGAQAAFAPHVRKLEDSPFMDLSRGYEAYAAERKAAGSGELRQVQRKTRKLEREVGALRLEARAGDPELLAQLIAWKRDQYRSTDAIDVFAFDWTGALLERILAAHGESFAGMLSVLYVADRVAAIHFGMFSRGVLHWWFPAYTTELAKHSPGRILLHELAKASSALGIRRIDLGKGSAQYKDGAASGAIELAEGCVDLRRVAGPAGRVWRDFRDRVRAAPLPGVVRNAARKLDQARQRLGFR